MTGDAWSVAEPYERYVGRWSRPVAKEFLSWLAVRPGARWLDAGCGTGALTGTVLAEAGPAAVVGIDMSQGFLSSARHLTRARFLAADAAALPFRPATFDAVVSGLALNFVPTPQSAVAEFTRVAAPGAVVAAYVWDYTTGMQMMRYVWNAARDVDPSAADQDEALRFPICHPDALHHAWSTAALTEIAVRPIEVPTRFTDFNDFWQPFLGGQGPAPTYLARLPPTRREAIRALVKARLPHAPDGTIPLTATAWAVRGTHP
ncbi:class I SAM-dependent methyltransferase [Paractinoplanes rishiriensis]|uniref:Methyltransferase n=1 Tax=Paractinoplanes rishiriensis TaxID=1050105 RepID=A0A919JTJ6_9ACTN|nr:class I SAM-dependent methyltransferase [Actinoplanes rishiriensis]GIE93239.1 methyltransferase [Actinoplanes rishiriensis]